MTQRLDGVFERYAPGERHRTPVPSAEPRGSAGVALEPAVSDALLRLALELPGDLSLAQLAPRFVDELGILLPELAIAARIATSAADYTLAERLPHARCELRASGDLTPLSNLLGEHWSASLSDGCSSLHLSAPRPERIDLVHVAIGERAARILSAAVERCRLVQRTEKLKAHLMNAEKLASLGRIVAGVVHELNNPLTSILAGASLLSRRLAQPTLEGREQDVERVQRIADAAERILSFTRDLVAYARPVPTPLQSVRIKEVIDRAVLFCEHEFSTAGVAVERGYTDSLPEVLGVGDQLTQVFVNLFTNAVHAMTPRGGSLRILARLAEDRRSVVVEVCDSGDGIPDELLSQVFEPFFTTKPRGHGTGLGLSIVRDIISAHHGSVIVASQHGQGTTFGISLPTAGAALE